MLLLKSNNFLVGFNDDKGRLNMNVGDTLNWIEKWSKCDKRKKIKKKKGISRRQNESENKKKNVSKINGSGNRSEVRNWIGLELKKKNIIKDEFNKCYERINS